MTIAFVNAGAEGSAGSGNITLGAPASPQNDDIWIAAVHSSDQVAHSFTDWTQIVQGNGGGTTSRLSVWYFRYAGSTPNLVVTHASGQSPIGGIAVFRGCVTSGSPVDTAGAISGGTDGSIEHSAINPTQANCALLVCNGSADDNNRTALGGDYGVAFEDTAGGTQNCYQTAAGTPDGSVCLFYDPSIPDADTGTITVTQAAADAWASVLIALKPDLSQTVSSAGNVGTGEVLGTAQLDFGLSAFGAIATGEALGSPQFDFTLLDAGAIGGGEQFGNADFAVGDAGQSILDAGAISGAEIFGAARLDFALFGAGAITGAEAFGSPSANFTLTGAGGIVSEEAAGGARFDFSLAAASLGSLEAFGSGRLDFTLPDVGAIGAGESFGAARLDFTIVDAGAIVGAEAFGAGYVGSPGDSQTITGAGGIAGGELFGAAVATGASQQQFVPGGASWPLPARIRRLRESRTKSFTPQNARAASIVSAETFGAAGITLGRAPQTVAGAGDIASAEAVNGFRSDFRLGMHAFRGGEAFGEIRVTAFRAYAERKAEEAGLLGL